MKNLFAVIQNCFKYDLIKYLLVLLSMTYIGCNDDSTPVKSISGDITPSIIYPENQAIVSGLVTIIVDLPEVASENIFVEFYINDSLRFVDQQVPWHFEWNTDDLPDSTECIIQARVYLSGQLNSTSQEVSVTTKQLPKLDLRKMPYTMTPTTSSVRILWQTPIINTSDEKQYSVEYGLTSNYGNIATVNKANLIDIEGYMYEIEIDELQPNSFYHYRITNGAEYSQNQVTKTAPAPGTDFKLMVGGDSRSNPYMWGKICRTVATKEDIDLAVFVGDYVGNGNNRDEWEPEFFEPGSPLFSKRPFIGCIGNHETAFGPSTYYDYVSLPDHPENGDPQEAYYSHVYGDINFIVLNTNDNSQLSFTTGSVQHNWLKEELNKNTSKWVFIVQHTPVLSTSNHGRWTGYEKGHLMPVYEDFAAKGGKIIVFNGDDHNFEHLYKDGVQHVRSAGGGASLYHCDYNLADKPYSIYHNVTFNYATVDVSSGGDELNIAAHYPDGSIFYEIRLTTSDSPSPNITIIEPDGNNDETTDFFQIRWTDSDPDDDAKIDLYYTPDISHAGNLIVEGLSEDDPDNYYIWPVQDVEPGSYYIKAIIDDQKNDPLVRFSQGPVTVVGDTIAPIPIENMQATYLAQSGEVQLTWLNPTYQVPAKYPITGFTNSLDGFMGEGSGTATGSLQLISGGYNRLAMRINYVFGAVGDQYGAFKYFSALQDWSASPKLEFAYRGDGSDLRLKLIVSQDNLQNGSRDDQWYNDSYDLSSEEWQNASFDLSSLKDMEGDNDVNQIFDFTNIFSLEFIITGTTSASGYAVIDEINLIGSRVAESDFSGVVIIKNTERYPQDVTDGVEVYRGIDESFTDSDVNMGATYYFSAFAFDEVPNYSVLGNSSVISIKIE